MSVDVTGISGRVTTIRIHRLGRLAGLKEGDWDQRCDFLIVVDRGGATYGASFVELKKHLTDEEKPLEQLRHSLPLLEHLCSARMQDLIGRFLAPPPGVVLDVGGGPGRYGCWLAAEGYQVHLVDPVPKLVEQARAASAAQPDCPLASAAVGDARSLPHGPDSADAVLLMGPLYHLPEREQRLAALREAHRALKPGGILVAKAVNRFASLLDGICRGFVDDLAFVDIIRRDLADGRHRGVPGTTRYFTTAYFHRPDQLAAEICESGFHQEELFTVQGPAQFAPDLDSRMADPARRAQLLDLIRQVERESTLLGAASHIACIAEKPTQDT